MLCFPSILYDRQLSRPRRVGQDEDEIVSPCPFRAVLVRDGGQITTVTTKASPGLLQLAGSGIHGQIMVSANDWWGVIQAFQDLATDFGKVTGTNLTLGNWHGGIMPGKYSRPSEERPARRGPQWGGGGGWNGPPYPPNGDEASPQSSEHNKTAGRFFLNSDCHFS